MPRKLQRNYQFQIRKTARREAYKGIIKKVLCCFANPSKSSVGEISKVVFNEANNDI